MRQPHSVNYYPGTAAFETPKRKYPTKPKVESTPTTYKPGNSTNLAGPYDKKINNETLDDIHEGVKREVMNATIYNDPHLLNRNFPDAIFGAGRNQMDITLQCRQPSAASPPQAAPYIRRSARLSQKKKPYQPTPNHRTLVSRLLLMTHNGTRPKARASQQEDTPLEKILNFTSRTRRNHKHLYSLGSGWRGWPETSKIGAEYAVAEYLNDVVDRARCFFSNSARVQASDDDFVFSARYANRAVKNDRAKRKPDIVLVPRRHANAEESNGWGDVRAVGELKINADFSEHELLGDLAERARLCFGSQTSRRFVFAFSLRNTKMTLWKYDRSGVLVTQEFDVHKDPIAFLRAILGLALGSDYHVGYDPSFTYAGDKKFVQLNRKKYEVLETIKLDDVIRGRGTVALRVRDGAGREFLMKDQWVDRSRATKEFSMLEALEEMGVQKVPRLVDYQLVSFKVGDEVVLDSTENDRVDHVDTCEKMGIETRDHYRLLITPFGDKLGNFRSLRELLSVFRDFVEGIKDIREKDVVHRDISLGNLILVEEDKSSCRKGYLIDFDYAVYVTQMGRAIAERTGTLPFMPVDILLKEDIKHEYYHDLESLFYVLIWILFTHEGPGVERRDFEFSETPLHEWMGSDKGEPRMASIALSKISHMETDFRFKRLILNKLPAYFKHSEVLKTFLKKLRNIIFRQTPDEGENIDARAIPDREKGMKDRNRHDVFQEIFDVFDEAIHRLENEPTPPDSGKETTSASGGESAAPGFTADVPDGIQMRPLNCLPHSDLQSMAKENGSPELQ